jgi:pimeloyl-ACP methyl ester carboxylesterase
MTERLRIAGRGVEAVRIPGAVPELVLLHEGLGSLGLWRDLPQALADRTGRAVVASSRYGNGFSEVLSEKRGVRYMHDEAQAALPALLAHYEISDPVLIGHSDGASIALIYGKARAMVLLAPHVFVEEVTVASIAATRRVYETTDLRARIARHHADGDRTFYGWNDIWLDPAFRSWNIEGELPKVSCPLLLIQGANDEYGTLEQLDRIARGVNGPVERLALDNCGHSPQRDRREATLEAIARFVATST